jgi:hypothetical protein
LEKGEQFWLKDFRKEMKSAKKTNKVYYKEFEDMSINGGFNHLMDLNEKRDIVIKEEKRPQNLSDGVFNKKSLILNRLAANQFEKRDL